VEFAGPYARAERLRGGYSASLGSRALDELGGERVATHGGHWNHDVAWTPAVRRLVEDVVRCPGNATD
jgi:hypothetical protein